MIQIEAFKEDVWQAVWSHAKSIFRPILLVSLAMSAIGFGIFYLGFQTILGDEFFRIITENQPQSMEEMMALQEKMMEYISSINRTKLIGGFLIAYLSIFVVYAYFLHAQLNISQQHVLGSKPNLMEALRSAMSKKTLQLIFLFIVIGLIYMGVSSVAGLIAGGSVGLQLVFTIIAALVMIRLLASLPALVHGDLGISDALKFSWQNITWKRAGFVVLVGIVSMIAMFLFMILLQSIFNFIPSIGSFLNLLVLILVNGFAAALIIAMLSASFFRYADIDVVDESSETDLVPLVDEN